MKTTHQQTSDELPCETAKDNTDFRTELSALINKHSMENGSNTPDFILSDLLTDVLMCFDGAVNRRNSWHDLPARLVVLHRERDQWRACAEKFASGLCRPKDGPLSQAFEMFDKLKEASK